jgi:zinc D-Ala-D-Ala dipeptidase
MKIYQKLFFVVITVFFVACKSDKTRTTEDLPQPIKEAKKIQTPIPEKETEATDAVISKIATEDNPVKEIEKKEEDANTMFTELTKTEHGIAVDLRYATTNNFTKKQIYDCGRCYLRPEAAAALIKVHHELKSKHGYGLKVFDCFRPRPYQQRLWDIVPNPDYVTPPNKGSMHSRGLAVDLTIVDDKGKEMDMGTAFDFFGKEAHTDYKGHSEDINSNRKLLTDMMQKYGFKGIRTEWWHFSFNAKYGLDEWVWPCSIKK